jgi:hypothetical protein
MTRYTSNLEEGLIRNDNDVYVQRKTRAKSAVILLVRGFFVTAAVGKALR